MFFKEQNLFKKYSRVIYSIRFISIVLSGLLLTIFPFKSGQAETIEMGYFSNIPHISSRDINNDPKGPLFTFLDEVIGPKMGVTFHFVKQPIARILAQLESGEDDGAVSFGYTKERAQRFNYPEHSFFSLKPVLAVSINNPLQRISSPADIRHLNIAYAIGAIQSPFIKNANIQVELTSGENPLERNLKRLYMGRLKAVYWPDEVSVIYCLRQRGWEKQIKILRLPEESIPLIPFFPNIQKSKIYPPDMIVLLSRWAEQNVIIRY
jgi:hypothetical protein